MYSEDSTSTTSDAASISFSSAMACHSKEIGVGEEYNSRLARRPPNAFLVFCKKNRPTMRTNNPKLENRLLTKKLGRWWAVLSDEEKELYKSVSNRNKERFFKKNPNFKWYKLPAPPLRRLSTRPSKIKIKAEAPIKSEEATSSVQLSIKSETISSVKLADESQLGALTSLLTPPKPPNKRYLQMNHPKSEENTYFNKSLLRFDVEPAVEVKEEPPEDKNEEERVNEENEQAVVTNNCSTGSFNQHFRVLNGHFNGVISEYHEPLSRRQSERLKRRNNQWYSELENNTETPPKTEQAVPIKWENSSELENEENAPEYLTHSDTKVKLENKFSLFYDNYIDVEFEKEIEELPELNYDDFILKNNEKKTKMAKPKKTRPSNSLMDYKGLKAPKKRRQNINNNKDEDDSVDSDDSGSNYIIDTSKWRRSALKNRPNMSGEHPVATTYTSTADNPVTSRIENTSSPRDQRTTHPVSGK
ncbi:HMG box transcription factor BBX [Nilaparvata lugens]|uniref:HMG box transcription factor BBX n=1 Tax=Nilaparvata lugens TaxID=108931 RepID=UPI00193C8750|nr:HMG box transcription factor BBX [Nilaparvata lugens]